MRRFVFCISLISLLLSGFNSQSQTVRETSSPKVTIENQTNRVNILVDGELFTSYIWPRNIMKPVLYPVIAANGTEITRGYPLAPRAGERVDHPHHAGIWFNYGDVNRYDFWNNSDAIPKDKKGGYGTIVHDKIGKIKQGKESASFQATASWIDANGLKLLTEQTQFIFEVTDHVRIIDRITTLTTGKDTVFMNDNKEGLIAIRVARQFELPSKEEAILTDSNGNATTVKAMNNDGVTGSFLSSEGIKDEAVWGTRGQWMELSGKINNDNVSIVLCDHHKNIGFPTYWHARGYGLFAANPLGWSVFTKGEEKLNFRILPHQSITFRYRFVIVSGHKPNPKTIEDYYKTFNLKY